MTNNIKKIEIYTKMSTKELVDFFMPKIKMGITDIVVYNKDTFKYLCRTTKSASTIGIALQTDLKDLPELKARVWYKYPHFEANEDSSKQERNHQVDRTLFEMSQGTYVSPKLEQLDYTITDVQDVGSYLRSLTTKDYLACDIETTALSLQDSELWSIAFCDPDLNAGCFRVNTPEIKDLLKSWFISNKTRLIFHKANFDIPMLIYHLFMDSDFANISGMIQGINAFRDFDDTLVIAYLCTNSITKPNLGLKELGAKYLGSWAVEEVKDISKLSHDKLVEYNCLDVIATVKVYQEYAPRLIKENQLDIYLKIMRPTVLTNIRMQLQGLPVNKENVDKFSKELDEIQTDAYGRFINNPYVETLRRVLAGRKVEELHARWKKKRTTVEEQYEKVEVKPGSTAQMSILLYEIIGFPVLEYTKSKNPSCSSDTIRQLLNYCDTTEKEELIKALLDLASVTKINNDFIPILQQVKPDSNGNYHLVGYFNVGGTISGRLASNQPNLQNLPSTGTPFAKAFKHCFSAPKGWKFVGLDYSSLEDYISALLSKDPNKLIIYENGYDSHCYRTYYYYQDKIPDISLADDTYNCYLDDSIPIKIKKEEDI